MIMATVERGPILRRVDIGGVPSGRQSWVAFKRRDRVAHYGCNDWIPARRVEPTADAGSDDAPKDGSA
jgi:hypothetical protein